MAGDDVDGVFDGLVEGEGACVIVEQLAEAGVRAGDGYVVFGKHLVNLFGGVAEKARELDQLVADLRHFGNCAGQVVLGDIAHRIHLQTVIHSISSFLCARRGVVLFSIP